MPFGWAAAAATVISAGVSIYSGIQAQEAANKQAEAILAEGQAQKTAADYQATVDQQQATYQQQVAAANEADYRRQQSRLLASRRAALGGSGVDPSMGSSLLTSEDMGGEAELAALRIRNGGDVNAIRLQQEADLTRFSGASALNGSYYRAGAAVLQGQAALLSGIGSAAGTAANAYYRFPRSTAPPNG